MRAELTVEADLRHSALLECYGLVLHIELPLFRQVLFVYIIPAVRSKENGGGLFGRPGAG